MNAAHHAKRDGVELHDRSQTHSTCDSGLNELPLQPPEGPEGGA